MRPPVARLAVLGVVLAALSLLFVAAGDVLNQPIRTIGSDPFDFGTYKLIQYYVTYQDLGFVRRGLPGSIIGFLAPNASHVSMYAVAASVALCLVLLYWFFMISSFAPRGTRLSRGLLYLLFLSGPAAFWQVGYDLGRYDHINTILLLASMIGVERKRFVVAGCLSAVAVLVHEASFFMFFPLVLAATLGNSKPGLPGKREREGPDSVDNGPLLAVTVPVAAALAATMLLGGDEPGREAFEAALARTNSPGNEFCAMCVWTRGLGHNLEIVAGEVQKPGVLIGLLAALVYLGVFCLFYFRFHAANGLRRDALTFSPFFIAPLFLVGHDFERWLAVTVMNMTIVLGYKMRGRKDTMLEGVVPSRSNVLPAVLLFTAVLGPLGVATAFPLLVKLWKLVF